MTFTEDAVRDVAELANLRLTPEEIARMAHDLGEILTHIEKLSELDTSNVEPMAQVLFEGGPLESLRDDTVTPPLSNDAALANAPDPGAGFFKVPKVIER